MGLVQVAQRAQDLTRATAFYELLLGRKPLATFVPPGLVFFDLGDGVRLLLDRVAPPALIYVRVDDVHQRVEELEAHGVKIDTRPHHIFTHEDDLLGPAGHEEWQAFVRDTEGNLVGLISFRPVVESDG